MSVTQQYPQNEMSMFLTLKKELFEIKDGDILHNNNQINVLRISLWIGQALIAGSLQFTVTLPLSENLSISILYICERNAGKLVYIYLVYLWKKCGKTCLCLSCISVKETRENLSMSILYICERNAWKLVYIYLVYLWEKRGKTASNPVTKLSYWCTVRHVCAASGRGCAQYKVYLN